MKFLSAVFFLLMISCNTLKSPFSKRSAHEKYGEKIRSAGLEDNALGKAWFAAAEHALSSPQSISIPYSETGFFAAVEPRAPGFIFSAERGQKIKVSLSLNPDSIRIFMDLFKANSNNSSPVATMDTTTKILIFTVTRTDSFILRLQPELLVNVQYTITFTTGPSLAFPVAKSGNPRLISFWGNSRDNGARKHEGVDIAAKFRAPALAAAEGTVSSVTENRLGGKVVFLRNAATGDNLYYAHLDSQIAYNGQKVKPGDTLGLIGNTGNARNTVPHLHFGIYTYGGAIDPFPFINPVAKAPKEITASLVPINRFVRTTSKTKLYFSLDSSPNDSSIEKGQAVFVLAASGDDYRVRLPGNITGYLNSRNVTDNELKKQKIEEKKSLQWQPSPGSPIIDFIPPDATVDILGTNKNFYLVRYKSLQGWITQ